MAGRSIRMIELHDLLAMKLRAGRLKDDYDISQIVFANGLDEQKLAKMVSADQMSHFDEVKRRA